MTVLPISFNHEFYVRRAGQTAVLASATAENLVVTLDLLGLVSPAAYDMPLEDVIAQVNEVNGREFVVERVSM